MQDQLIVQYPATIVTHYQGEYKYFLFLNLISIQDILCYPFVSQVWQYN
jgi:hypothetical protein